MRIAMIVRLYPPVNSSGAKRAEALSKYWARFGHEVTVITPMKSPRDGELTEATPQGVALIELDRLGRRSSTSFEGSGQHEGLFAEKRSLGRRLKDLVMHLLGQLPDPRLPFALSFGSPLLAADAKAALRQADVIFGSCPPWSMLLAALIAGRRFRKPAVLDYRDHFGDCHEMPGGRFAKALERWVDTRLVKRAALVVTVSPPMTEYYAAKGRTPVKTILNGYDAEKVSAAGEMASPEADGLVHIAHTGFVSPGRIPTAFLEAWGQLALSAPDRAARIRLHLYGKSDMFRVAIDRDHPGLAPFVEYHATVPHLEILKVMHEADYLLFCGMLTSATASARGVLTTKLFEYLGTGRPILASTDPTAMAADILRDCSGPHLISNASGDFLEYLDDLGFYERKPSRVFQGAQAYSREAQAREYAAHLTSLTAKGCEAK